MEPTVSQPVCSYCGDDFGGQDPELFRTPDGKYRCGCDESTDDDNSTKEEEGS